MTKKQKKQAEDFIGLLERAHDGIKKTIDTRNTEAALDLLAQCQECAIKLGEIIEAVEGEDFVTIPMIEDYCELAYQFYEKLSQNIPVNSNQVSKALRKSLIRMGNSVKYDIPERKEVVFLPYKASMWDSLESVWKAADEDPDCDAYVIPIPYFDKNPDGSFKEMHYEGDQYPAYVPVTHYDDYDITVREPDMIFIHNPYDEYNYVTSVAPKFYSKNLKQYTEKLVYIPYFVLGEIDPENAEARKGIAHFCVEPGVLNADVVVVQSEDMRKAYIEILSEAVGEETRPQWEKKILGLGSPKMDKVLETTEDDFEIPGEWMRVLAKPDGSRKKVILYNTSVTALLQHEDKMLVKMRSVFETFKESVDDVALLWRPHPLIKATIESMRPELWADYEKLVEEYRAEGWGIYDDSAELDRAIALSDAYYGDHSSLVQLCQQAGMPVMIQDVEIV
ncbi:MAG: hypothetical protein HFG85_11610 [Dorea sp.]|uniref:hypothetical protein n=1 Tax=Sporofaciens sp. JLR.KK001 TaxID=3112621 RepID=UPI002170391F|nr:hypothetical protein [Dorea sp.]